MRIPIREQLALLVLFCSLLALAVIAIATWVTNYNFVVNIRLSSLSLTASLYSEQLRSNLVLLESSTQAISTRVILQNALQRYNQGNTTAANWVNSLSDIGSALTGVGTSQYLLQARVLSKNGTGIDGPYGLLNVTGSALGDGIPLPYNYPNGSSVFLGDPGIGYPSNLYPNLTFTSKVINSTFNQSFAFFEGMPLYSNTTLLIGPSVVNSTFSLISMTVPVINNTSHFDTLGWLTVVANAQLVYNVEDSITGLGNTGTILLIGPATITNKFPPGVLYNSQPQEKKGALDQQQVQFVLPPIINASRSTRHAKYAYGNPNTPFTMGSYPAVLDAVTTNNNALNNAGSLLKSNNEEGDEVSVGFAISRVDLADWLVLVEESHGEVIQPINHLRNVLVACVFGTVGGILVLLFPIAHYSVRPIRRLREATKRTVDPFGYPSDAGSIRSSTSGRSDEQESGDEEALAQMARKEGFMGYLSRWRRRGRKSKAERDEQARRQTFRIPGKVVDGNHFVHDELTDLTTTFNEMSEELVMQYERLEERVKERTQELELSKKAAEAANESKTLFIANISHELKTPLNGILGMCAVCMQEEDQTRIKRSLGIIYKSGDLLLHLLTDLLTFSKNQIGQQLMLDEKEFRIADVSAQILSIFEKQAKEGSIKLSLSYEGPNERLDTASGGPGEPGYGPFGTGRIKDMCLYGDQHRILQVIINLVSNSLKFTPPGGSVNVCVRCVGETSEKAPSSRKGSTQSRQSRQSLQSQAQKAKARGRHTSGSNSSVSSPGIGDAEKGKNLDTALAINGMEPKSIPYINVRERSSSPPPINARTLLFEFEVDDTGPGIPVSQQKVVFEPFVQGDLGLSKKYGGTGLGLSICSQLANLMRGTIWLKSEEGVGSTFTMRIPLKFTKERADSTNSSHINLNHARNSVTAASFKDEANMLQRSGSSTDVPLDSGIPGKPVLNSFESPASKPRLVGLSQPFFATSPPLETSKQQLEAMERVAEAASRSGKKVRVLVAEDNKVNQEVVLRMLKLEDIYDVTVAKDGQEAFELVKESMEQNELFSLIFMDVQMPNLDGLQSTRLIREMGFSAPIVALTAFAEESNVKECLDSGMNFFLPKPIRRPALKQVLKRYCDPIPEATEESESPPGVQIVNASSRANDDPVSPMS